VAAANNVISNCLKTCQIGRYGPLQTTLHFLVLLWLLQIDDLVAECSLGSRVFLCELFLNLYRWQWMCDTPSFSANREGRPLGLCLLTFKVPNFDHPIQFGGLLNELPLPQPSSPIPFWLSSSIHCYSLFISCELKAWNMVASHGCCLQCFLRLENMVFLIGRLEIIASLVMEWHWQ